ncbi:MAG: DUF5312 family protein [Treponema sp.]
MAKEEQSQTFDSLVSGISTDERKTLLKKMQNGSTSENSSLETSEAYSDEDSLIDLKTKISEESIFERFWLWLISIFTSTPIEEVYNKSIVSGIAKNIEQQSPGLVDYKHKYLTTIFYSKLVELKHAADFFKGYIDSYLKNPGAFYILLGSLVMPEIGSEMDKQADPYTYSFAKDVNSEMRTSLLRKMDDILQKIPADKKTEMYACVRSVEWLTQFTKLPFQMFLSKFSAVVENIKICSFDQIGSELISFSRILCNGRTIPDEVIEALYLFSMRQKNIVEFDDVDRNVTGSAFMDTASSQISLISMFISTVPLRSVSCVVYNNSLYVPENFGGGEDWFIKYKGEWKKLFDRKWESWLKDCKKEKLKGKLMEYFELANFPVYTKRPWASLWGGAVQFNYELTLGFLNEFIKNIYPSYAQIFKIVTLEGDFAIKENRLEFNDTVNLFANINESLDELSIKLSSAGEYGAEFERYSTLNARTKTAAQKIQEMMEKIESNVKNMINLFGDACRTMQKLLTGLTSEKLDADYGNLANIASIQGRQNKKFRENLEKSKLGIDHAFYLIKEIEPLDKPIEM